MTTLKEINERVRAFRDARDWKQFHRPKSMAISLMLEAAEVAEIFQWKNDDELSRADAAQSEALGEELADVLYWVTLIANDFGIDLASAFDKKMAKNEERYPVDRARGRSDKYTKL